MPSVNRMCEAWIYFSLGTGIWATCKLSKMAFQQTFNAIKRLRVSFIASPISLSITLLPPRQTTTEASTVPPRPLPPHLARLLKDNAIRQHEQCSIDRVDITMENSAVTSCGHVFCREAITRWIQGQGRGACPFCRAACCLDAA
jgi:hypothetical protein